MQTPIVTASLRAGASKAAAQPKTISFTVPADTVERLERWAKAANITKATLWRAVRDEAAEDTNDPTGIWSNPQDFLRRWAYDTKRDAEEACRRLSIIEPDEYPVECEHRGKPIAFKDGKRVPTSRDRAREAANEPATAATQSKAISFTLPGELVAKFERWAEACGIAKKTLWQKITDEVAHMVTDPQGSWNNPRDFSAAWSFETRQAREEAYERMLAAEDDNGTFALHGPLKDRVLAASKRFGVTPQKLVDNALERLFAEGNDILAGDEEVAP